MKSTTDLITDYYQAFNTKNWDGMLACVAEDIRHDVNEGNQRGGREQFRAFLAHMNDCYDENLTDIVIMVTPDGQRAAAEFIVNGIYQQTDGNLPPARGQNYSLSAGAFFELNNGQIKRVTTYYNLQEWLRQIT